jgi:formate hydrogenlyase subunit 3
MDTISSACWRTTRWKTSALFCWRRGRDRAGAESTGADCAGFIGGLYHLVNHSLFKSTLFLGAGSVWFRTGHRDIEKLGGIGKKMPVISLAMLVGLMAMAALPPLNGFAGEWVIYQSFFALARRVYRPSAGAAAGGWAGDYRRAGGDVYGESLRRDLPRRTAHEGS